MKIWGGLGDQMWSSRLMGPRDSLTEDEWLVESVDAGV